MKAWLLTFVYLWSADLMQNRAFGREVSKKHVSYYY